MTPSSRFVELDRAVHDRKTFDCGAGELNRFLQLFAARHRAAGISMTMVLSAEENKAELCAYYTLSHTEIERQTLTDSVAKRLLNYPIPVILLAQLAVDRQAQGRGLGKITLISALQHAFDINEHLPSYAVVVDVLGEQVQGFYEQYGFELLDTGNHCKRFYLPMKTIEKLFTSRVLAE